METKSNDPIIGWLSTAAFFVFVIADMHYLAIASALMAYYFLGKPAK